MTEWIGRYRILRPLGEGGMGRLFVGEAAGASGFARRVVVKVVRDELDVDLKQALLDEARLAASLVHRNIVPVLDLEEAQERRLVILEYVDGLDLRQVLAQTATLPWTLAAFVAMEVAAGLDYAHRHVDKAGRPLGIVHRDVSPANVLLSWEGEVKLTDFGVAKFRRHDESGAGLKGNLAYMAPEQARGDEVDARADVFALGVVLYEAIAGNNPFVGRQPLETLARVRDGDVPPLPRNLAPAALADVVARATARDPQQRYATAAALREALVNIPGQPADPARQLVSWLDKRVRSKQHAVAKDALLEAVLGGGRPVTQAAAATKKPSSMNVRRWAIAAAVAMAVAALFAAVLAGVMRGISSGSPPRPPENANAIVNANANATANANANVNANANEPTNANEASDANAPVAAPAECPVDIKSRPTGARIVIDGESRGITPARLTLSCRAEPYKLHLALKGHAAWTRELPLTGPDEIAPIAATLLARGTLSVNAIPWANVFLDGRALGHTPKLRVPVDPGRHQIKLVTKKGDVRTRAIEVPPGRPARVTVDFAAP
jgi:serine/threonine-protein kinase